MLAWMGSSFNGHEMCIARQLYEWQISNPDQRLAYPVVRTSSHCELSVDANEKAWRVLKSITEFRRAFASSYAESVPDHMWAYGSDLWELVQKCSLLSLGPHQEPEPSHKPWSPQPPKGGYQGSYGPLPGGAIPDV